MFLRAAVDPRLVFRVGFDVPEGGTNLVTLFEIVSPAPTQLSRTERNLSSTYTLAGLKVNLEDEKNQEISKCLLSMQSGIRAASSAGKSVSRQL